MKTLVMTLLLVAGPLFANASRSLEPEIQYLSWCNAQNQVEASDQKGGVRVVADCAAQDKVCGTISKPVIDRIVVSAACMKK